jgi:glycosyltransferase involved in cell wall biosynthesis
MQKRTAIVYDTLFTYAGAERILEQILNAFPDSDLIAIADLLPEGQRSWLAGRSIRTTYVQKMPFVKRAFRSYAWAMPAAIESVDTKDYDLVVSCTYAFSNGILTLPGQNHINYLTARPLKYLYDERSDYIKSPLLPIKAQIAKNMRIWAESAAKRPNKTLTVSNYVGDWMKFRHGVDSKTIYPPVDLDHFGSFSREPRVDEYYVTTSRLQKYKRVDVLVEAFNKMRKKLVIIGSGPEESKLKAMAGDTITFAGYKTKTDIAETVSNARAFVFASNEDFGMAMVEAHACGTPIVAFGHAGALEINRDSSGNELGEFFMQQTPDAVIDAIERFECSECVSATVLRENARRFSTEKFIENIRSAAESA